MTVLLIVSFCLDCVHELGVVFVNCLDWVHEGNLELALEELLTSSMHISCTVLVILITFCTISITRVYLNIGFSRKRTVVSVGAAFCKVWICICISAIYYFFYFLSFTNGYFISSTSACGLFLPFVLSCESSVLAMYLLIVQRCCSRSLFRRSTIEVTVPIPARFQAVPFLPTRELKAVFFSPVPPVELVLLMWSFLYSTYCSSFLL